jgi:progressive ankylosis protein
LISTEKLHVGEIQPLTWGGLFRQFLPLSLSDMIMVLAGPIIIAGLARLPDQNIHLAAYGVAEAMAILVESPIIMLLHASTALSRDRAAFEGLRRFMIWANIALTALFALIAFTPLYDLIFRTWLGQPAAVATAARPAFALLLLWPAAIGWRRFYQGVLITRKRSALVGMASIVRLVSLVLMVILGVSLRWPGAVVACAALGASVIVEAVAVTIYAERELKRFTWAQPSGLLPQTTGAVARWYLPLMMTAILIWVSKPALSGGIARAGQSDLSLAAWPAIWTTMMLVANAIRAIQQMVITQATSGHNYRMLTRFSWVAGLGASLLLAIVGYSPAGGALLTGVTSLSGDLAAIAIPALRIGVLFPLGVALQNQLQGLLIRVGRTRAVNVGALTGGLVLFFTMLVGIHFGWLGTVVGATATMTGQFAEVGFLLYVSQSERTKLQT